MKTRALLLARFPQAFQPFGAPKLPLKIGIREDIRAAAADLPGELVSLAIRDYAQGRTYHQAAAVPGATRINLQGEPAGVITDKDAAHHAFHLARITARKAKAAATKGGPAG